MGLVCCRLLTDSKEEAGGFTRNKSGQLVKVDRFKCADGSVMKKLSTIFEEDEYVSKKPSVMSMASTKIVGIYSTEKVAAAPV